MNHVALSGRCLATSKQRVNQLVAACRASVRFLSVAWLVYSGLAPAGWSCEPPATPDQPSFVSPRTYLCFRAEGPLEVDGILDESAWRAAPWSEDFVDIEGSAKPHPRFRTRVKMLWDDRYFYIAAEMEEPHLQASFTQRDSYIFHQDHDFEVFLDPDGDSHNYGEFEINALNTGWDLHLSKPYKNGGKADDHWDIAGLKTAVHLDGTLNDPRDTDRGWTLELAFPWTGLSRLGPNGGAPPVPRDGEQWRVNFSRVEWRFEVEQGRYRKAADIREDNWVWSPQGTINMHRPETWGYVQFVAAPAGSAAAANAAFRPDPAERTRQLLHRVHYAQQEFHQRHGRWAVSFAELKLALPPDPSLAGPLELQVLDDGYRVTAQVQQPDGTVATWHVREDALVWRDAR